jgi:UDP-N-acetylmuramyl pentapeptide phosphotransferase/UDP-N-acetylglucosamine-1-phosphate transferase
MKRMIVGGIIVAVILIGFLVVVLGEPGLNKTIPNIVTPTYPMTYKNSELGLKLLAVLFGGIGLMLWGWHDYRKSRRRAKKA